MTLGNNFYCPHCGKVFFSVSAEDEVTGTEQPCPNPGDGAFCATCLKPLVFETTSAVRPMSRHEWLEMTDDSRDEFIACGIGEPA